MRKVFGISNQSKQTVSLPLEDGSSFRMTLSYNPRTLSWIIVELTHKEFILNGYKIYNSENFLHQFRNLIPFGLACRSVNNREPMLLEDFNSDNSQIYLLDAKETTAYWGKLSGN